MKEISIKARYACNTALLYDLPEQSSQHIGARLNQIWNSTWTIDFCSDESYNLTKCVVENFYFWKTVMTLRETMSEKLKIPKTYLNQTNIYFNIKLLVLKKEQ